MVEVGSGTKYYVKGEKLKVKDLRDPQLVVTREHGRL